MTAVAFQERRQAYIEARLLAVLSRTAWRPQGALYLDVRRNHPWATRAEVGSALDHLWEAGLADQRDRQIPAGSSTRTVIEWRRT